jgi:hypothetical protein
MPTGLNVQNSIFRISKNNIFLEVLIGGYDNFKKELRKPGT